jgi:multidrug efflux pump subunit AcrB
MILSKISINRPVFATMMILALVVLGIYSYRGLSVELFPDVDFPLVVVSVTYPGATPENMESEVMKKIEDAVNPLSGVKHIETKCLESYAYSVVTFEMGKSADVSSQEVREKVAGIQADLPSDIEDIVIQKWDPKAMPIISVAVAGDRTARELTFIAKETVKKRLESLQGVGNVELIGGEEREILVELDLASLEALNLSIFDIQGRLAAASLDLPGGTVKQEGRDFTIRTMGRIASLDQIRDLVVKNENGKEVRMRDIAVVKDTTKELESISRLNGKRAVALNIVKQSGANTVDVAKRVKTKLEELKSLLPTGVSTVIASDNSVFTVEAIDDVMVNILYGSLLAVLVIFLFLADSRPTLISAAAIPTSIIATFIFMKALGFTLNFMTLLGLSLAVGLLIDDAIVVIENIYRHKTMGKPIHIAAYEGTSEIGLAVLATTFSLVVVFVPVSFMQGIVGRFFFSFGMTVAVAVMVSLFEGRAHAPRGHAESRVHGDQRLERFLRSPQRLVSVDYSRRAESSRVDYCYRLGGVFRKLLHRAFDWHGIPTAIRSGAVLGFVQGWAGDHPCRNSQTRGRRRAGSWQSQGSEDSVYCYRFGVRSRQSRLDRREADRSLGTRRQRIPVDRAIAQRAFHLCGIAYDDEH